MTKKARKEELKRRNFLKSLGAITATGLVGVPSPLEVTAQQRPQENQRVTREALHARSAPPLAADPSGAATSGGTAA